MFLKASVLKGILFGTLLDNILSGAMNVLKSIFGTAAKEVTEKGVHEVIGYAKGMLEKRDRDEQILSQAKLLLSYTELQAWHDKMSYIDELCKDANGKIDRRRSERLREYLRRLAIKETAEQTAQEMRYVGGMPDEVWQAHLHALDIEHKYEHPRMDAFRTWTVENAKVAVEKMAENRNEVDGKIAQTADDMRSWADKHFTRRKARRKK